MGLIFYLFPLFREAFTLWCYWCKMVHYRMLTVLCAVSVVLVHLRWAVSVNPYLHHKRVTTLGRWLFSSLVNGPYWQHLMKTNDQLEDAVHTNRKATPFIKCIYCHCLTSIHCEQNDDSHCNAKMNHKDSIAALKCSPWGFVFVLCL